MVEIGSGIIDKVFMALDRQIGLYGGVPIGLAVCGGTALAALGLVVRTTKDVDVLGVVVEPENGLIIQELRRFPEWLAQAAKIVERDFELPESWLNLGPASQVESGLPEGLEKRLVRRNYGQYLTIYFVSRIDQIYFKLYAAVDRNDYHVQDLLAIKPTEVEIEKAAKWAISQDVSDSFRLILKDFLKSNGYEAIAEGI